jgi:hypothetical protein
MVWLILGRPILLQSMMNWRKKRWKWQRWLKRLPNCMIKKKIGCCGGSCHPQEDKGLRPAQAKS